MIRINLLPYRAARRKENVRRQVSVFFLLVVFVIVALLYYTVWLNREIDAFQKGISATRQEITLYKAKADKVTEIKKKLANLQIKLDVVKSLEAQRKEPVTLMDAMTRLIIPERMWLTRMDIDKQSVQIKGLAFDNKTVADFMTALESSPLFNTVNLKTLQMQHIKDDIRMKSFDISCSRPVKDTPEASTKKGKK